MNIYDFYYCHTILQIQKKYGVECSTFYPVSGRDDKTRTCDLTPPRRVR